MADNCVGPINIIPNNNQVTLQDNNKSITVIDNNCCTEVSVTQPITSVIQVLTGLPGRKGDTGASGSQGPSGSSAPFTYVSGITWSTTSSIEITGSLTISGSNTFKNIGPTILSGSVNVSGSEFNWNGYKIISSDLTSSLSVLSSSYASTASYYGGSVISSSYSLSSSISNQSLSSSYSLTASYVTNASSFPYTGSAIITGSLAITGSVISTGGFSGSLYGTSSYALTASYVNPLVQDVILTGSFLHSGSNNIKGNVIIGDQYSSLISSNTLNQTFWYPNNITIGNTRNTFIGSNDTGTPNTSGPMNTLLGSFTNISLSSGGYNLILGNYNNFLVTNGNYNVGLGSNFISNTSNTLGILADVSESNSVVIGNTNKFLKDWHLGAGYNLLNGYGTYELNWYASDRAEGSINDPAGFSVWRFNGSRGTGNANNGNISFAVSRTGISGNTWNPYVDVLTIYGNSGNVGISGSLIITGSITGSLFGTASYSSQTLSSSYALTASYVANASSFPYTGSALITGSLGVTGSISITGSLLLNGNDLETQIVDLQSTMYLFNYYNFI